VKTGVLILSKLYVVGIGPGSYEQMTIKAARTLEACDVIVGYTVYVELIKKYFPNKNYIFTAMTKEKERCRQAIDSAKDGKTTAIISSGDAEIYAMAALVIELAGDFCDIEIIPGITAAISGGALLGSPLTNDYASISLSDRLTPWETIEKRLESACTGDFVICIYNPSSKGRPDNLKKACKIIKYYRNGKTICAAVKNIGREAEHKKILMLDELENFSADMFTTIFIGNSQTRVIGDFMVTPRGYKV